MPKNPKPNPAAPRGSRSPFAGRRQTGAGYHSEKKYGKKDRRRSKEEPEEESEPGG